VFRLRFYVMARVILITGGARSGKSDYARRLAEALPGPRAFVATCPPLDDEMRERIRKHRLERVKSDWHTIEEPLEPAKTLWSASGDFAVFLVDCLTLWINNLLYRAEQQGLVLAEEEMERTCDELLAACARVQGTVIFVTNEVGLSIVPENKLSRLYRDLVGTCNQRMARGADEVYLVTCGIPLTLKKREPL
jgi:adenosylcobinamide kinase / adenosylcobinamide-phosphate guanylyltransferase